MRKSILIFSGLITIVAVLGAAIWEINAKDGFYALSQTTSNSKTENGLQLTSTLKKSRVRAGEPIELKISLKNITKDEIQVLAYGAFNGFRIEVKNQRGDNTPLTETGEKAEAGNYFISGQRLITIKPDESREITVVLNELYQMNAPDTYQVSIVGPSQPVKGSTKKNTPVLSNVLTVNVTK